MADKLDIQKFAESSDFSTPLTVTFDKRASLTIAQQIIWTFAGVLFLSFVLLSGLMIWGADSKLEKGIEAVKFLVESVVPLVTLAVGYYLGDRSAVERRSVDDDDSD